VANHDVVIIGAGIGGLTCAIELALAGCGVTVVERSAGLGGKMREVMVDGVGIDAGPTVLTMRWVFEALFERAGAKLGDYVTLKPLSVLARHAWSDSERLDLFADQGRSAEAIGDFAGAREAAGYLAFCAEAQRIYQTLKDSFLTVQKGGPISLAQRVGLHRLGALMAIRPYETLWRALGDHFHDPRLRQLFGRYATYCGSSPFEAPATLMLIAHVEQAGVWTVEGGMQRLAEALGQLAASLGVIFRLSTHVDRIEVSKGRARGVVLAGGERLVADTVVTNADARARTSGLLGPAVAQPRARPVERSLSAVTWALKATTQGFPLARHNVFFSNDYAAEFDDLFKRGRLPGAPTVYVCAQDRDEPDAGDASPRGARPERLFILMNAPAQDQSTPDHPAQNESAASAERELATCETQVFQVLQRCGLAVERTGASAIRTTPAMFNALFPATGGALYGQATHGWAAAFARPAGRTPTPGLYQAGGGAHPGAGAPMAALSGRLAAQALLSDLASARSFHRVATPGGISMRSATIGNSA
jgi:1-hydroxycarotenoid 3,4-desaturase